MNRIVRQIIDIVMTFLFIILMGYHITGNKLHEVLGVIIFILFILHHILNIKWYKSVFKGKYSFQRTIPLILDLLLFIVMIGMIISSVMISGYVFYSLDITTTMFARKLHMLTTFWGFVLISVHIGMHIGVLMNKLSKKIKGTVFEYGYYFVIVVLLGLGFYSLLSLRIWEEMFLLVDFKFYDYNENGIIFYIKYVALLNLSALVTYFIFKIKNKKGGKQDER